jgi:REP element-mobilizing transposase RayT
VLEGPSLHLRQAVQDDSVVRSEAGDAVARAWAQIPAFHPSHAIDAFVVMPNHVHGILVHHGDATGVPTVVGLFERRASRLAGMSLWQRSSHDRVLRDEAELTAFREYVQTNPLRWALDRENPDRPPPTRVAMPVGPILPRSGVSGLLPPADGGDGSNP